VVGSLNKRSEYFTRIKKALEEANLLSEVTFTGRVIDNELYEYYKGAKCFLFCSLVEGFGMPILEAMSLGVPVITSSTSSLSEVAGEAALLVNPYDPKEISKKISDLFSDERLYRELVERGLKRSKEFGWSQIVDIIDSEIQKIDNA